MVKKHRGIKPDYPDFGDYISTLLIIGAIAGLLVGIIVNFFPAPKGWFETVGRCLMTAVYTGAGVTVFLILNPIVWLIGRLVAKLLHKHYWNQRKDKLYNLKIVKDILNACQSEEVCGVLLSDKECKFYKFFPNAQYLKDEIIREYVGKTKKRIGKPEHWQEFDNAAFVSFGYNEKGYAELDEVNLKCLAEVLRESLNDYACAFHEFVLLESFSYTTVGSYSINSSTATVTANTNLNNSNIEVEKYSDYLLYRTNSGKYVKPLTDFEKSPKLIQWD